MVACPAGVTENLAGLGHTAFPPNPRIIIDKSGKYSIFSHQLAIIVINPSSPRVSCGCTKKESVK
jgi:hypothetical protein